VLAEGRARGAAGDARGFVSVIPSSGRSLAGFDRRTLTIALVLCDACLDDPLDEGDKQRDVMWGADRPFDVSKAFSSPWCCSSTVPLTFMLDAATSAHQIEGGTRNDWTLWERGAMRRRGEISRVLLCSPPIRES